MAQSFLNIATALDLKYYYIALNKLLLTLVTPMNQDSCKLLLIQLICPQFDQLKFI